MVGDREEGGSESSTGVRPGHNVILRRYHRKDGTMDRYIVRSPLTTDGVLFTDSDGISHFVPDGGKLEISAE